MVELKIVCNDCRSILNACFFGNMLNVNQCPLCRQERYDRAYKAGLLDGSEINPDTPEESTEDS